MSAHPFATADAPGRVAGPGDRCASDPAEGCADEHRSAGRKAREKTARRLLGGSLEHSCEPRLDIDRGAPLAGRYGMPAHRVSRYSTGLWDQPTEEQPVTLSVREVCSVARVGPWFETILMQMLLRYSTDREPRRQHIQYARNNPNHQESI